MPSAHRHARANTRAKTGASHRLLILGLFAAGVPVPALADDFDRSALERLLGEPVTTAATGKPQRASDVPVAMDIITAEQIRRSGAHDIPGVLGRFTSLDVFRHTPDDYSVGIRGYATPNVSRLLVLVDGRQVYLDDWGRTVWSAIPVQLSEIRQIEVVRGPNSALFGFNAAAGVINIVTYNPAYDRVTNVVTRLGTGDYGELSGVATAPLPGNGGLRISTGLRREDAFGRGYELFDQRANPRNGQVATKAEFGLNEHVRAGIDASYDANTTAQINGLVIVPETLKVWSLGGHVSADTNYGLINGSAYYNGLGSRSGVNTNWQQGTTIAEISDTLKLGAAHTLRGLLQYRSSNLRESDELSIAGQAFGSSVQIGYQVASVGGMWNWAITDGLEWTAALRYDQLWLHGSGYNGPGEPFTNKDYDRRAFGTLAWNAGLVWKPSPVDTVRLSAARGIQPPTLLDLGVRFSAATGAIAGSPFAPTTVVDNYEVGYRRRLRSLATDIDLTAFTQTNHALSSTLEGYPTLFPPTVSVPTSVPVSLGTSHVTGVEVGTTSRLGGGVEIGLKYRGAFTTGNLLPTIVEYQRASPRHIATAHVGWTDGKWEADLFGRYASSAAGYRLVGFAPILITVKDFVTASARVAYHIKPHLTVALEAEDMLQAHQAQSIGTLVDRRFYLSLRADF